MPIDVGGLDPITVSLRDHFTALNDEHDDVHAREREVVSDKLLAHDKHAEIVIDSHFKAHEAEHAAVRLAFENAKEVLKDYKESELNGQIRDREAVQVALQAVRELANLHAIAHEREHHSHEVVHQREREAAGLAREDLDQRLKETDQQRVQIREQTANFMARTEIMALIDRVSTAVDAQTKAADGAHTRMDQSTSERVAGLQSQIDKLNIANAANNGASQRTTYLIGAGFTFITIIVAIVGIYLSSKGMK